VTVAIEIRGLTKVYGDKRALDGVDLTVEEGSVFGFLGPNGAGKTTTLRMLTGLAHPTSGSVRILDSSASGATDEVRRQIGFLPDVPGFYDWMTADEFLRFAGGLFGLSGSVLDDRVGVLLDLAGLAGVDTRIGGYSRGMKQRLGVAQALVNAPRLLMLDEPTSALDPMGRKELLDMLASLRGRTTVFFSTHILADVERICDTVAILDHGKVVAQAPIEELKARYGASKVLVEVTADTDAFATALEAEPWVAEVTRTTNGTLELKVTDDEAAQTRIPAMVAQRGIGLKRLEAGELGLEEVFVELVGGGSR
jgi:ABC-2 type transport system ATP-binding protein